MTPFLLRREKTQVEKELPPKVAIVIKVELSDWQKKIYNLILKGKLAKNPLTGKSSNQNLNNPMVQLRKICNHPFHLNDNDTFDYPDETMVRSSGKFEILDRIVPKIIKFGHKILIFSQFKKLIDVMCHFFAYRRIKFLVLEGSMSHEIRDENVMKFKTDPEQ